MYVTKKGIGNKFYQYECLNICQVKNTINEITKTNSTTAEWKDLCYSSKKMSGELSIDYIFFDKNGKEKDCTVFIGYDETTRTYLVWVECD